MSRLRAALLWGLLATSVPACSAILDFDDTDGLPCPCLPENICVNSSNRCVARKSVDPFRSCAADVDDPDELCKDGTLCIDINGRGPRCLPGCTATSYSTPESGLRVAEECPPNSACFATERGGFCDEGLCDVLANNCEAGEQCISFNGAGLCFIECRIFASDACAGAALCHPIGDTTTTACITAGNRAMGDVCDDIDTCMQNSGETTPRPLICDRPLGSTDSRRCRPACVGAQDCLAGETCTPSRTIPGEFAGICVPG